MISRKAGWIEDSQATHNLCPNALSHGTALEKEREGERATHTHTHTHTEREVLPCKRSFGSQVTVCPGRAPCCCVAVCWAAKSSKGTGNGARLARAGDGCPRRVVPAPAAAGRGAARQRGGAGCWGGGRHPARRGQRHNVPAQSGADPLPVCTTCVVPRGGGVRAVHG